MSDHREDQPPGLATLAVHGGGSGPPTVEIVERRLAALEGGTAAVAVPEGAALLTIALQPLMRPGDRLIVAEQLGESFKRTLATAAQSFGWDIASVAIDDIAAFERAVTPKTQAILVAAVAESGEVADVAALAQRAKRAGVPLMVDNTIATPALCRPIEFGADVVIHANARFLAGKAGAPAFIVDGGRFDWRASQRYPGMSEPEEEGPGTAFAGAVGNFAYAAACRRFRGAEPGLDVVRVAGGLETLPLRMARHAATARAVAEYLAGHRRVTSVAHAGLPGDRHHTLAERYCPAGPGAVVAFAVEGAKEAAAHLLRAVELVSPVTDVRAAQSALAMAGGPGGLRLWAGLEDPADIIAELEAALAAT